MEFVKELAELTHHTDHISLDPSSRPADSSIVPEFSPSVSAHLDRIYKALKESTETDFLRDVQLESRDAKAAGPASADPLTSLEAFLAYMSSTASSALRPAKRQGLLSPIADYFISSSHNTYLTGNQLYSDAAASAYTDVCIHPFKVSFAFDASKCPSLHVALYLHLLGYFGLAHLCSRQCNHALLCPKHKSTSPFKAQLS